MNITTKGLDEFIKQLDSLQDNAQKLMKEALYDGAGVLADEIKKGLNALPIASKKNGKPWYGTSDFPIRGVTEKQKEDILKSFGVSRHISKEGSVMAYIGVNGNGYTEGYYHGRNGDLPIALLLRELESGMSWMQKIPTIRPAINRAREPALDAMQKSFDKAIKRNNK